MMKNRSGTKQKVGGGGVGIYLRDEVNKIEIMEAVATSRSKYLFSLFF